MDGPVQQLNESSNQAENSSEAENRQIHVDQKVS